METQIQLIGGEVYPVLVRLPFLYESPTKEIFIDRESHRIDHVRDMISSDGSILRLIRVFKLRNMS